ncbi:MAG: hypothetical protein BWX70_00460 [Verrucomicrobia bacterium ADurb.Bin070]|jgi:hypothetical protein|nr:MAG: hypothetical protein BWX70_00460 [Verrucomicrobia bacterium ADurb.Bin070]
MKKSAWRSFEEAKADLENQAKTVAIDKPVSAFVMDCTL